MRGTKYRIGNCLLQRFRGEIPLFVEIVDILIQASEEPIIIATPLSTLSFNKHYHAFEVGHEDNQTFTTFALNEIADYHPLNLYQTFCSSDRLFIVLKHYVLNENFDI